MPRNPNPNTKGLEHFREKRSENKRNCVLSTLKEIKQSEVVDRLHKSDICRKSGISKTFLRNNPDLNELIDNFLVTQNNIKQKVESKSFSQNSKDILIESLKRRNIQLEQENKKLKEENRVLYGRLARKI